MQDLAGMLYESLQKKIVPLADDVIVYPAHGEGSSCGKNLGPETYSTIGEEKNFNYALQQKSRLEFIKSVTDGLSEPPQYFSVNAKINKEGYTSLDGVLEKGLTPLSVPAFKAGAGDETIVLDTRPAEQFSCGFIPGSVSLGLEGRFAEWAGSLLSFDKPILLITEPGREKETIVRLARVGFDKIAGYLEGGYEAWKNAGEAIDMIIEVEADELMMDIPFDPNLIIIDVRKPVEFAEGHVNGAVNIPLNDFTDPASMANIQDDQNLYVHCQGGYRSTIAISLMKRQGIHNLRHVVGWWNSINEQEKVDIKKDSSVLN
jgi:rhodanese-related sulfurtransferase